MGSPLFYTKKGPKLTLGKVQANRRCCGADRHRSLLVPPGSGVLEPGVLLLPPSLPDTAGGGTLGWPQHGRHGQAVVLCGTWAASASSAQRREQDMASTGPVWRGDRKGL